MIRHRIVVGMGCLVMAACTGAESSGVATAAFDEDSKESIAPKCPGWACPELDATLSTGYLARTSSFDELSSPDGTRIVAAALFDGTPVQPKLMADRLFAFELAPPFAVLEGQALQGLTMWMALDDGELFKLVVGNVYTQSLVSWEGDPEVVPAYEITSVRVDPPDPKGPALLCGGAGTETDPRWGGVPHAAILFEGDAFDFAHETVAQPLSAGQFNIACSGSTMAAMHLSRHTAASNHDGKFATTHDQRVAMWKMFEADYCGTAQSFTADNYPLRWLDSTGWAQPSLDLDPAHGEITSIEAIWGPGGAVCLDTPRAYPRSAIPCALPPCTDVASWPAQGHIISANPPQ